MSSSDTKYVESSDELIDAKARIYSRILQIETMNGLSLNRRITILRDLELVSARARARLEKKLEKQ